MSTFDQGRWIAKLASHRLGRQRETAGGAIEREPRELQSVSIACLLAAGITWMLLGPVVLVAILFGIVLARNGWFTALDLSFYLTVAVMIGCRWFDRRPDRRDPTTGERPTWEEFRASVRGLLSWAVGAWLVANVLGNHILPRIGH